MLLKSISALVLTICVVSAQVYFPESETNDNKKPQGHNRQPVSSQKCGEGELLYPGDNNADWACDCKPLYVYHPQSKKCYQIYSKGPCLDNEIIVLPKTKAIPICTKNSCPLGKIKFNSVCSKLEEYDGCPQPNANKRTNRLYVNPTTLQLYCTVLVPTRVGEEDSEIYYEGADLCPLGGKRAQEDSCANIKPSAIIGTV